MAKFKWFYNCHLLFAFCHLKSPIQGRETATDNIAVPGARA
jgi:hypothetical protein